MNNARLRRLAPLSGIVMVVLWLAGIVLIGNAFGYNVTPEEALDSISGNSGRLYVGTLLGGFWAVIFLIWFAGSIFKTLNDAGSSRLAAIALGGAIVAAIGLALGYGVLRAASVQAGRLEGGGLEFAAVMHGLYSVLLAAVLSLGFAAMIGATGVASLRTRLFPEWLGWTSVLFAVGLLTPLHWIFEGLATVWIVVVSILLSARARGGINGLKS